MKAIIMILVIFKGAWGMQRVEPLSSEQLDVVCEKILKEATAMPMLVNSTPEIVKRRVADLREKLENYRYMDLETMEGRSDFVATSFLRVTRDELKQHIDFVKEQPQSFSDEFKNEIFQLYNTVFLELELRQIGRSLRFVEPHYRSVIDDPAPTEEIARRFADLEQEVRESFGTFSHPNWPEFRSRLHSRNIHPGFPPFRLDLDNVQHVIHEIPFAPPVAPVTITEHRSEVARRLTESYLLDEHFRLDTDALTQFPSLESKIVHARRHVVPRDRVNTRRLKLLDSLIQDIVTSYELLYYVSPDPDLYGEIGPDLLNILGANMLRFFIEVQNGLPFEIIDEMKRHIFYNQPQLNTQLVVMLENALKDAQSSDVPQGRLEWYIEYLANVLLRP